MEISSVSNGVDPEFSVTAATSRRALVLRRDAVRVLRIKSGVKTGGATLDGTGHITWVGP